TSARATVTRRNPADWSVCSTRAWTVAIGSWVTTTRSTTSRRSRGCATWSGSTRPANWSAYRTTPMSPGLCRLSWRARQWNEASTFPPAARRLSRRGHVRQTRRSVAMPEFPAHAAARAPALLVEQWFNTDAAPELEAMRGKVVLLHAFQMLCPGCLSHGLPQAERVHRLLRNEGLVVIGLHTVFEHHDVRSEERRVGKGCGARWAPADDAKK